MSITWVDNVTPLDAVNMNKLEQTARKAQANGYASLDATGKVPAAQLPSSAAGASGTLAARPAASVSPNSFYYASDQDVLYFSTGTAWLRVGLPAGATTQVYSLVVPTGWVAYDGTALPSNTGIYADLATHLGGTTTPDTRGRALVSKGTHADVDTLGDTDGSALANRSPRHNSTNGLTLPTHTHSHNLTLPSHGHSISDPGHSHTAPTYTAAGSAAFPRFSSTDQDTYRGSPGTDAALTNISIGNPTSNPAISGLVGNPSTNPAISGAIGPGGSVPTDTAAYITFSVVLAKL